MKRVLVFAVLTVFLVAGANAMAAVATFDDPALTPPPTVYTGPGGGAYYNGSDGAGGFTSGDAVFTNTYNAAFGSWDGWAYSNTTDTTTAGFTNPYSAYTGDANSGTQYGVYFEPFELAPTIAFGGPAAVGSAYFTNTTYAALSMLNGDSFSKQFGGVTGNDPDWFLLTVSGVDAAGGIGGSVEFYLADYRFSDNGLDYIIDEWTLVDLSDLGIVYGLLFDLTSSDNTSYDGGETFFMNTPAYFAMDDLEFEAVPIPGAVLLFGSGLIGLVGIRRKMTR